MTTPARDPWAHLRQHTSARIALGRTGVSLPTRELLDFALAHAQARDAIHLPLDTDSLSADLQQQGWPAPLLLHSQARDRHEYLLRPDLGRRLDADSVQRLGAAGDTGAPAPDLVLVVGDGLSALGIQLHGAALLGAIRRALEAAAAMAKDGIEAVAGDYRVQVVGDRVTELDMLPKIRARRALDPGRIAAKLAHEVGDRDDVLAHEEFPHELVGSADFLLLLLSTRR